MPDKLCYSFFGPESTQIEADSNIPQLNAISPQHVFILLYKNPIIYPVRFMLNVQSIQSVMLTSFAPPDIAILVVVLATIVKPLIMSTRYD